MTLKCFVSLAPWRKRAYLEAGVPMGAIPVRRELVTTDACLSGWGAVWQCRTAQGRWSGRDVAQHINVLELRAVQLALASFLPHLAGRHVLVRPDNMATVFQVNHQGGTASPSGQPTGSLFAGGPESGGRLPLPTEDSTRGGGVNMGPLPLRSRRIAPSGSPGQKRPAL